MRQCIRYAFVIIASSLTACGTGQFTSFFDSSKSGESKSKTTAEATEAPQYGDSVSSAVTDITQNAQHEALPTREQIETDGSADVELLTATSTGEIIRSQGNKGIVPGCIPAQRKVKKTINLGGFRLAEETFAHFGWGSVGSVGPQQTKEIENITFELGDCVAEDMKTENYSFCELSTRTTLPIECRKWSEVGGPNRASNHAACLNGADKLSGISTDQFGQRSAPRGETFFVCQKVK